MIFLYKNNTFSLQRLFSNRDYVFNRRFIVDHAAKTIIIANRITEHENYPIKSDKFRVIDYWSNMVVKPYTDYDKPGIEFALTYYENSGVNIPSTVTSWVAMKAMPEYLAKLREATRDYEKFCKSVGSRTCRCKFLRNQECTLVKQVDSKAISEVDHFATNHEKTFATSEENPSKEPPVSGEHLENSKKMPENISETVSTSTPTPTNQNEYKNSYWKYLHPTYYFN